MDFKFTLTLDNKTHKGSVHYPTTAAITLTLKNIFYRHYKTQSIDLPYIGDTQISDFIDNGYIELIGVRINGKNIDTVKVEKRN